MIEAQDIPISFGICVGPEYNSEWLDALVESIKAQNVPEYEIILIFNKGERPHNDPEDVYVKYIECDGWLPQKKNLFSWFAQYENLVIVHDYYLFDDDWYDGVKEFNAAVDGKWHMMGVTLSAAGSLQWFASQLCTELFKKKGIDPYEVLNEEAAAVPAGSEGLFFLPYLAGERTPHADANARGCFIGLTNKHARGHMARSVMEGVAYSLRESLQIIQSLDVPVKEIRLSGGGAKSVLWKQILADAFGQKVCTINAEQGPAFGVALLAAVGDGAYKNIEEACKATISVVDRVAPRKVPQRSYDAGFPVYQNLYQSLKERFVDISKLS